MTVQVKNFNKSKEVLQNQLNTDPSQVSFYDPSIFNSRSFTGEDVKKGEHFAVVMDHPRRMRFALVTRRQNGTFKVG